MAANHSPWARRLETLANGVVVLTCLLVSVLVITRHLANADKEDQKTSTFLPVFPAGTTLPSTPELRFADRGFTVLVGLNSRCRFCEESMPELRRLSALRTHAKDRIRILAVGVEPQQTLAAYLAKNELNEFEPNAIDRQSILAPVVQRTPSIALVDSGGNVVATWPGLVTKRRMDELLLRLSDATTPQSSK